MYGKRRAFFFGITISEIAFILFFAMLLFAFFQFSRDADRIAEDERIIEECREQVTLIQQLRDEIAAAINDPDITEEEVIRRMVEVNRLTAEVVELESLVEKLQGELDALGSVKSAIEAVASSDSKTGEDPSERMRRALQLLIELELWIRSVAPPGTFDSPEEAQRFALEAAAEKLAPVTDIEIDPEETKEDILRRLAEKDRQLNYCMSRLNECRGGRDLPPCWVNERNPSEIDFLLKIDLHDDGLEIRPGDEPSRQDDFLLVPGAKDLVGSRVSLDEFEKIAQVVFDHSDRRNCRHYVLITDRSERSYKSTLTIEEYFYKVVKQ
jgi:hypothetical protein